MLYVEFESPRKPYPIPVRDYAIIYRSYMGTEVVFEYDGSQEVVGHDLTVSRKIPGKREGHARIYRYVDRYYIVDLCSTNGTLVDGYLLKGELRGGVCEAAKRELRDGSLIVVGLNTAFRTMFAPGVETLPAGAFIVRSVDELRDYPTVKVYPLDEKNVIVKLPDKPGVYGDRVRIVVFEENRMSTTAWTLVVLLLRLENDVAKDDADAFSVHAKVMLNILESAEKELGLQIDRADLNLIKVCSADRNAFRTSKKELEKVIRKILNEIQIKRGIHIPR